MIKEKEDVDQNLLDTALVVPDVLDPAALDAPILVALVDALALLALSALVVRDALAAVEDLTALTAEVVLLAVPVLTVVVETIAARDLLALKDLLVAVALEIVKVTRLWMKNKMVPLICKHNFEAMLI